MAWSNNLDIAEFFSSAYKLGKGTAGSESDVGEIREPRGRLYYTNTEIKGGACLGPDTTVEVVTTGVGFGATFFLMQNVANLTKDVFSLVMPGSTLSTGPTKKTLTIDANTICGVGAVAGSRTGRWVFHTKAVAADDDTTYDLVFPRGIVFPTDEEFPLDGTDAVLIPCVLIGLPDANNDIAILGKDAA